MKKQTKNIFKCFLATLCIAFIFITGFSAFTLNNSFKDATQPVSTVPTEAFSGAFTDGAYIVHGNNVYKYSQQQNSTASSMLGTSLAALTFNEQNTLKLIFIKDSVTTLSTIQEEDNIASVLTATKTSDQIEIYIQYATDAVCVDTSLDAKYSFGHLALNASSILNYANGEFSIGENRGATSLTDVTEHKLAQIFTQQEGSVTFRAPSGEGKVYTPEVSEGEFREGRAFMVTGGTLTIEKGITLEAFYVTRSISSNHSGGAIFAEGSGGTTVLNISCTILNCKANFDDSNSGYGFGFGGAIYSNGTVNLKGAYLSGNKSHYVGGAVYVYQNNANGGKLEITDGTVIDGNTSKMGNGGAISASGQCLKISNSTIINNHADNSNGGAIYVSSSIVEIKESTVISNNTAVNGAGLYISSGSAANISDTTISDNIATTNGGGIYTQRSIKTSGKNNVTNNAAACGGGMYVDGVSYEAALILTGTEISGNTATTNGGGIYITGEHVTKLEWGAIKDNAVNQNNGKGGGVFISDANISLGNIIIGDTKTNSLATDESYSNIAFTGGGLYAQNSDISILNNVDISRNYSIGVGGGMYLTSSTLTNDQVSFFNIYFNNATNGGGLYANASTISLGSGYFYYNNARYVDISDDASNPGGGGAICSIGQGSLTLSNTSFYDNSSACNGGAIYCTHQFTMQTNNSINLNSAANYGGAIYASGSLTISSVGTRLTYNSAEVAGGAIYATYSSNINAEIASNSAVYGGGVYFASVGAGLQHAISGKLNGNMATHGGLVYASVPVLISGGTLSKNQAVNGKDIYLTITSFIQVESILENDTIYSVYKQDLAAYNTKNPNPMYEERREDSLIAYSHYDDGSQGILTNAINNINLENIANGRRLSANTKPNYIVYLLNEYKITFVINDNKAQLIGGNPSPDFTVLAQDENGVPTKVEWFIIYTAEDSLELPNIERDFKNFLGWRVSIAEGDITSWTNGELILPTMLTRGTENYGNVTLKYEWEWHEYKIEFNANGHDDAQTEIDTNPVFQNVFIRYNQKFETAYQYVFDQEGNPVMDPATGKQQTVLWFQNGVIPTVDASTGWTRKPSNQGTMLKVTSQFSKDGGVETNIGNRTFVIYAYFPKIIIVYHDDNPTYIGDSLSDSYTTEAGLEFNLPTETTAADYLQSGKTQGLRIRYGYTFNGWWSNHDGITEETATERFVVGGKFHTDPYTAVDVNYSSMATTDENGLKQLKLNSACGFDPTKTPNVFRVYARYTPNIYHVTLADSGQKIYYQYGTPNYTIRGVNSVTIVYSVSIPEHPENALDYYFLGYYPQNPEESNYDENQRCTTSGGYFLDYMCRLHDDDTDADRNITIYPHYSLKEHTMNYESWIDYTGKDGYSGEWKSLEDHAEELYFTVTSEDGYYAEYRYNKDSSQNIFTFRPSYTITCYATDVPKCTPYRGTNVGVFYGLRATVSYATAGMDLQQKTLGSTTNGSSTATQTVSFSFQASDFGSFAGIGGSLFILQSFKYSQNNISMYYNYGNQLYDSNQIAYQISLAIDSTWASDIANSSARTSSFYIKNGALYANINSNGTGTSLGNSIIVPNLTSTYSNKYGFIGYYTSRNGTQYINADGTFTDANEDGRADILDIGYSTTLYAYFTVKRYTVTLRIAEYTEDYIGKKGDYIAHFAEDKHELNITADGGIIVLIKTVSTSFGRVSIGSDTYTFAPNTITGYFVDFERFTLYTPSGAYGLDKGDQIILTSNIEIEGRFTLEKRKYDVSFDPNGGYRVDGVTEVLTYTYDYGHEETISERRKNGYTLAGYKITNKDGGSYVAGAEITYFDGKEAKVKVGACSIIVTAQWTPNIYTLTLRVNNFDISSISGQPEVKIQLEYGAYIHTYSSSTYSSSAVYGIGGGTYSASAKNLPWYTIRFMGWSEGQIPDRYNIAGDITRTAMFEYDVNNYTITYITNYPDGTTHTQTRSYTIRNNFNLASQYKNGYTFGDWTVTSARGSWEEGDTYPIGYYIISGTYYGDVTLTGSCSYVTYSLYLDGNGGTIHGTSESAQTISYKISDSISLPIVNRSGYIFSHWRVSTSGGNWTKDSTYRDTVDPGKYGHATLTAVWEVDWLYYTPITINADGGSITCWINGSNRRLSTVYFLKGSSQIYTAYDLNFVPYKYDPNTKYTYDESGERSSVLSIGLTTSKTGYSFAGLYSSTGVKISTEYDLVENANHQWTTYTDANGNWCYTVTTLTLDARWTIVNYNISYDLDGGTANNLTTTYNVETNSFTIEQPTRPGYTFVGWIGGGLDTATKDVTIAKGSTGDRTYKATWTENYYEVKLITNGKYVQFYSWHNGYTANTPSYNGTYDNSGLYIKAGDQSLYYLDDTIYRIVYTNAIPKGYNFKLWLTGNGVAENSTTSFGTSTSFANEVEITGDVSGLELNVEWNTITYTLTYADTSEQYSLKNPFLYKYVQGYWTDGIQISYDKNNLATIEYTIEDTISIYKLFHKDGGCEVSWKYMSGGNPNSWRNVGELTPGTELTGMYGNVTLNAVWTKQLIDLVIKRGQGIKSVHVSAKGEPLTSNFVNDHNDPGYEVYYGDEVMITAWCRDRYEFSKWVDVNTGTTVDEYYSYLFTMGSNTLWLEAVAIGEENTISFYEGYRGINDYNDSPIGSIKVRYEEKIDRLDLNNIPIPKRVGYSFDGYYLAVPSVDSGFTYYTAGTTQIFTSDRYLADNGEEYFSDGGSWHGPGDIQVAAKWTMNNYTINYQCLYSADHATGIYLEKGDTSGYAASGTMEFNINSNITAEVIGLNGYVDSSSVVGIPGTVIYYGFVAICGDAELCRFKNTKSNKVDQSHYISAESLIYKIESGADTLYIKTFYDANGTVEYGETVCDSVIILEYEAIWEGSPKTDKIEFGIWYGEDLLLFDKQGTTKGLFVITDTSKVLHLCIYTANNIIYPRYHVSAEISCASGAFSRSMWGNGNVFVDLYAYVSAGRNKITLRPYEERLIGDSNYLSGELDSGDAAASLPAVDIGGNGQDGSAVAGATTCTFTKPKETDSCDEQPVKYPNKQA